MVDYECPICKGAGQISKEDLNKLKDIIEELEERRKAMKS